MRKALQGFFRFAKLLWRAVWIKIVGPFYLWFCGVDFSNGVRVVGFPVIVIKDGGRITLGENVKMYSSSRFTPLGVARPCVLRALLPGAEIVIGSDVGISGAVICAAKKVEIGDNVLLGSGVIIMDTDFHPIRVKERNLGAGDIRNATCRPVKIDDGAFIGVNSIICKGVRVGANSVVGAGAVVTRDVPPNSIVAGNPSVVVGRIKHR